MVLGEKKDVAYSTSSSPSDGGKIYEAAQRRSGEKSGGYDYDMTIATERGIMDGGFILLTLYWPPYRDGCQPTY